MARITTVSESEAQGPQLQMLQQVKSQYGGVVPGIAQILLADLAIAGPTFQLYQYLNARPASPLTNLQLQMLATVVNGLIGGKP